MVPDDPELVRRSEKRTYEDGMLLAFCLRMDSSLLVQHNKLWMVYCTV